MTDTPQTVPPEDVFTWRQALQGSNLKIGPRYIGTLFAQYAKSPTDVWVYMDRLVVHAGVSKRQTQEHKRVLTDDGWLLETAQAHTGRSQHYELRVPLHADLHPDVSVEVTPSGARWVRPERVEGSRTQSEKEGGSIPHPLGGEGAGSRTTGWKDPAQEGGSIPHPKQSESNLKQSSVFDGGAHTSPPAPSTTAAAAADDEEEQQEPVAAAPEAGDDTQPASWSAMSPEQKAEFIAWENKKRGNKPIRQPEGFMRNLTAEERTEKIAQFFDDQKNKPTSLWDQLEEPPIEEWDPGYECDIAADKYSIEPYGDTWNDLLELFRRKHVKGHAPELNRRFIEDLEAYHYQATTNWCPYCGNAKDEPHEFNCAARDGKPGSTRPKYCRSCRTDFFDGTHTTDCATNS